MGKRKAGKDLRRKGEGGGSAWGTWCDPREANCKTHTLDLIGGTLSVQKSKETKEKNLRDWERTFIVNTPQLLAPAGTDCGRGREGGRKKKEGFSRKKEGKMKNGKKEGLELMGGVLLGQLGARGKKSRPSYKLSQVNEFKKGRGRKRGEEDPRARLRKELVKTMIGTGCIWDEF